MVVSIVDHEGAMKEEVNATQKIMGMRNAACSNAMHVMPKQRKQSTSRDEYEEGLRAKLTRHQVYDCRIKCVITHSNLGLTS